MSSFGKHLKVRREKKDISIEEVSKATKISISVLQALENDQYDDLPPKVYVRGFIRSYCRYVGSDETELLRSYEEAAGFLFHAAQRGRGRTGTTKRHERSEGRNPRRKRRGYLRGAKVSSRPNTDPHGDKLYIQNLAGINH